MKKFILGLMLGAGTLNVWAQDAAKLHVKIDAKGAGDSIVVALDGDRQTFVGKQGVFEFDVNPKAPTAMTLFEPSALTGNRNARIFNAPAVPGEKLEITQSEPGRYDINGSKFYAQYHVADLMMENSGKEAQAFVEKCNQMIQDGANMDSVRNVYAQGILPIQEKMQKGYMDYIKAHANEEATAYIIPAVAEDLDQMKAAVALLSPEVREGRMKAYYQQYIDQIEAQQKMEEEAAKLQAAGRQAPDFTLNDLDGKPFSLSSLKGKYVILDFWGSWCGWCIKGFPDMKEYYKKFAGKFEILGIDCNDSPEAWKDAVKKHELPWKHVYNTETSTVLQDYGITGFPTKIILDKDGKIVKTIVGEDPEFYTFLDGLFK